jgi:hypothetical protein
LAEISSNIKKALQETPVQMIIGVFSTGQGLIFLILILELIPKFIRVEEYPRQTVLIWIFINMFFGFLALLPTAEIAMNRAKMTSRIRLRMLLPALVSCAYLIIIAVFR